MNPTLVFYYALRSPYAWLADRLLADHLSSDERRCIEHVPFWEPRAPTLARLHARRAEFLYRPMSRERHLYILGDVKHHASRLGYTMRWPVDGPLPDWELPHLACLTPAAPPTAAEAVRRRLFAARWEQGRDICDAQVVAEACEAAGLPAPAVDAPADDIALAALERGYRHGVFGVPYFVVGREKFWGVDRLPFALRAAGLPWRGFADAWLGEAVR